MGGEWLGRDIQGIWGKKQSLGEMRIGEPEGAGDFEFAVCSDKEPPKMAKEAGDKVKGFPRELDHIQEG